MTNARRIPPKDAVAPEPPSAPTELPEDAKFVRIEIGQFRRFARMMYRGGWFSGRNLMFADGTHLCDEVWSNSGERAICESWIRDEHPKESEI